MTKKKSKQKRGGGSEVIIIIGLGAAIIVLGLILLTGGFVAPTAVPTTESLVLCNGKPCPSKGSPDAPVVMIEFSDYACGHCRDYNLLVEPILEQEYVATGKIRYVSHIFALWPQSEPAAAGAMCAAEQGKYWEYHHQAFVNQKAGEFATTDDIIAWGQQIGLDENAFAECVRSNRFLQDVQISEMEGKRAGANTTPTFFINGKMIVGNLPVDQFRRELDAALAAAQ